MNYDSSFQVHTPENVALEYPLAGIGSRFLASLVDHVLLNGILLLVDAVSVFAVYLAFRAASSSYEVSGGIYWLFAVLGIIAFAAQFGYFIFFEALWNGQTPGKRALKLRVVRANGLPISAAEAVIRNVIRIVDAMPVGYGVGLTAMFLDSRSRRLGDLAAGTLVIREQPRVSLESLTPAPAAGPADPTLSDIAVERLSAADAAMIADFLARRNTLVNRGELARTLLEEIHRRMERLPREEERADPEAALERISRALSEREKPRFD